MTGLTGLTGHPQQRRKQRNKEEREAVCREVRMMRDTLDLPIRQSSGFQELDRVLDKYAEMTHGGLEGAIPLPQVAPDARIEYTLPGKRILRPGVRVTRG